jgi:hypothetical protein
MPDHARRTRLPAVAALVSAALASILLSPAAPRAQSTQSARDARLNEMRMKQLAMRDLDRLKNAPQPKEHPARPTYHDVAEDFEQLQRENYTLAGEAAADAPLDYALIKKHASEVKKRASRLKVYLSLPKAEDEADTDAEPLTPEGLRAAAASLDARVNSFAWNPVFRRPDVVDLEQSSKASRDLAAIIGLSERIRRRAEELEKDSRHAEKK